MKRSLLVTGAMLLSAIVSLGQDISRVETFLGYSFVKFNSATDAPSFYTDGGSGQFAYHFNKWLGFVADLGVVHTGRINSVPIDNTMMNFLFGPRVSFRARQLRPYFQIFWGGVYNTASVRVEATLPPQANLPVDPPGQPVWPGNGTVTARLVSSQTGFAMTVGGGLDLKLSKHLSFRPVGVDYFLTRLQNFRTPGDNNQNNFRYTAGFNFNFGAQ